MAGPDRVTHFFQTWSNNLQLQQRALLGILTVICEGQKMVLTTVKNFEDDLKMRTERMREENLKAKPGAVLDQIDNSARGFVDKLVDHAKSGAIQLHRSPHKNKIYALNIAGHSFAGMAVGLAASGGSLGGLLVGSVVGSAVAAVECLAFNRLLSEYADHFKISSPEGRVVMQALTYSAKKKDQTLLCPLTGRVPLQPMRTPFSKRVYEREALIKWIGENKVCPETQKPLTIKDLTFPLGTALQLMDFVDEQDMKSSKSGEKAARDLIRDGYDNPFRDLFIQNMERMSDAILTGKMEDGAIMAMMQQFGKSLLPLSQSGSLQTTSHNQSLVGPARKVQHHMLRNAELARTAAERDLKSSGNLDAMNKRLQIPFFKAGTELPPPSPSGIRIGLPNHENNCWLNSILKFVCCTTHFDQMLTDPPPAGKEMLQGLIREIVISLRLGKKPGPLLNALLKEIDILTPNIQIRAQQDAVELLIYLISQLKWKPAYAVKGEETESYHKQEKYPRLGITYTAREIMPVAFKKYGVVNDFQTYIDITIPEHFGGSQIDLSICLKNECVRKLKPDNRLAKNEGDLKEVRYSSTTHLLNFPKVIMVYVKRMLKKSDGRVDRIAAPIKVDKNGRIPLTRSKVTYETIDGVHRATAIQPVEMRYYRIGAAIVQVGNVENGHYFCMERTADGTLVKHDNETFEVNPKEDLSNIGYFLRLDLV
jgi:hypothetical protein